VTYGYIYIYMYIYIYIIPVIPHTANAQPHPPTRIVNAGEWEEERVGHVRLKGRGKALREWDVSRPSSVCTHTYMMVPKLHKEQNRKNPNSVCTHWYVLHGRSARNSAQSFLFIN
jgi:hypothetical protein